LVKWWYNDAIEEKAFIRKNCDDKEENCIIAEKLSYEQADGFYAISPVDWETRESYIKALERNCQ